MRLIIIYPFTAIILLCYTYSLFAQNPIIRDQFSANPSARIFGDSVYLYSFH